MPRHSAKIEVGDLVELRSQHKLQKFYNIWRSTGIVTHIYVSEKVFRSSEKGKNVGQEIAKVYFPTRQQWQAGEWLTVPYNREIKILLKRMKKVRN